MNVRTKPEREREREREQKNNMPNQLKSLLEKLKTNQDKWIVISQSQALIRDAVEKFLLDESALTSPLSNPNLNSASYHVRDRENRLQMLEQEIEKMNETDNQLQELLRTATTQDRTNLAAEREKLKNQRLTRITDVNLCKQELQL
jgi:dihydrofolate reductase